MKRPSTTPTVKDGSERLQKILSRAGVSSRRAAEELIRTRRVTVNGQLVTELGTKANPIRDRIAIDGKPLRSSATPRTYILLHKPVGVVTTLDDPEGRPTVRDLLVGVRRRVFPVGRLDYHTAGLLLLTDDGDFALRLTHPRYGVEKTYHAKVKGHPEPAQLATLARGVRLPDGTTSPAYVRVLETRDKKAWLSIKLIEGKNRQVRRMCEAVGLPVEKLSRVALGPLKLGKLPTGAWRDLTPEEIDRLRAAVARPGARRLTTPATRGGRRSVGGGRGETRRPDPRGSGSGRAAASPHARTRRT